MLFWSCRAHKILYIRHRPKEYVARCGFIFLERAFNTVQGSGMANLRTKFGQRANVLKNPAAGLFRLSTIFNTKSLRSACAHDTYHWPNSFCRGFKCRVFLVMTYAGFFSDLNLLRPPNFEKINLILSLFLYFNGY